MIETIDFAKGGGLVPVVVQDDASGAVLMLAYADREALGRTLATGECHFHSRTRGPWHKGATSGNVLRVVSLAADCDRDALLARVAPAGPACHRGEVSCFSGAHREVLDALDAMIAERQRRPEGERTGRTGRLLDDRNRRLKKLGEEAAELAVACADRDAARAVEEAADLVYHALVAVRAAGGSWRQVRAALAARQSHDTR